MAFDAPSRGHLILKSHKPLPYFICAIPVPHPDTSIQQLRSTIVAILTGQVSARSTKTSTATDGNGTGSSNKADGSSALSYSEHLKQVTIHEWRMKSLILELRQNALIAPETRNAVNDQENEVEKEEKMSGFELQDDHECALLEHGDEVNLWLKPSQSLESLRLPKLSSKHMYGLPNQPSLDRSGTLLGNPPAYSPVAQDFAFKAPLPAVREPAEPSSHSSSVSAHPDVQFETQNRHWAPPNQHRVVVVGGNTNNEMGVLSASKNLNNSSSNNSNNNNNNNGNGVKYPKKEKPKRLDSAGYFSSHLMEQKKTERERPIHHRSQSGPSKAVSPTSVNNTTPRVLDPSASPHVLDFSATPAPNASTAPLVPQSPLTTSSPPISPPLTSTDSVAAQLKARQASFSKAEKIEKEKARRAGMKKMPSDALVVGPGVQGKFGRMASFDNSRGGSAGGVERSSSGVNGTPNEGEGGGSGSGGDTHGNFDAFVSFTAASADVNQQRPQAGRIRRPSNRSGHSEKNIHEGHRPSQGRRSSSSKVEKKSNLASLTRTEGANIKPVTEILPPMPMPRPLEINFSSSADNSPVTHSPAFYSPSASPVVPISEAAEEEDGARAVIASTSEGAAAASEAPSSARSLSKAEKRYLEVMKALDAEKEKQSREENERIVARHKREVEKAKAIAKYEEEQRKKKETLKWEVWEEIRSRQAKEKGGK